MLLSSTIEQALSKCPGQAVASAIQEGVADASSPSWILGWSSQFAIQAYLESGLQAVSHHPVLESVVCDQMFLTLAGNAEGQSVVERGICSNFSTYDSPFSTTSSAVARLCSIGG